MDVLSWAIVVAGIALAVHELWPVITGWPQRDRSWWSGLSWGLVGLFVAVGGLVAGISSAADARKTAEDLAEARGAIDGERRARTELVDALKTRHAPQYMNLRQFEGTKVIFECANDPESLWFTHSLGFELEMQGWRIVGVEIGERMDSGVKVIPLGGSSVLFPDSKDGPAIQARKALVSELEDGGVAVRPGGSMEKLPPNTVKVFVGPSPPLIAPTKTFQEEWFRERMGVKSVEEFVRPVFESWQKGENAFIKWLLQQPAERGTPNKAETE